MKIRFLLGCLLQVVLFLRSSPAPAEDWTRFHGPNGSGVSKDSGFPVKFDETRNLVWRTPVKPGKSSPVLTEHQIFLTGFENEKLLTQCFDRKTGKLMWERVEKRTPKPRRKSLEQPGGHYSSDRRPKRVRLLQGFRPDLI